MDTPSPSRFGADMRVSLQDCAEKASAGLQDSRSKFLAGDERAHTGFINRFLLARFLGFAQYFEHPRVNVRRLRFWFTSTRSGIA